jgi:hypothetical protein
MEYFIYDYTKVKKELNFQNYETFLSNGNIYKHYLFDLGLLQYDSEIPNEYRKEAKNILKLQKIIFLLPYPFIGGYLLFKKRNNFFTTNIYYLERQLFFRLFTCIFFFRILQKSVLKFQGDKILPEIKEKYKHNI